MSMPSKLLTRLRPRNLKWYHMYFALAAFDLMTVMASLYMSHAITGIYSQSVEDNRLWAHRLGQYAELSQLAANVNAPGNDVFDSRDVEGEQGKMNEALGQFEGGLAAVRSDLASLPNKDHARKLLGDVANIESSMKDMLAEATQIFGFFAEGDAESAGKRMATMDRKFAALNRSFLDLSTNVRTIQSSFFTEQAQAADLLRRFELLLAIVVLLMIGGVSIYGHKLANAMESAERERERHSEALREQTQALERAKDAAEAASVEKSRFLAKMSHEIRTPMNGVLGMTDLLLRSDLNDAQRKHAETVQRSGTALLSIINDILDLSRIEAGKLDLDIRDLDLRQCIEGTFDLLAEQARAKELDLNLLIAPELPVVLRGDAGRLSQILLNLIGNAIKFTEAGEVSVSATREPAAPGQSGDMLMIEVRDTGIGIAPDMIDKLFQPFSQADTSISRKFGGTGLGLSITRQLVTLMGGAVDVKSRLGRGTTVTLSLPMTVADTADRLAPITPDFSGRRLLVVDASYSNRRIMQTYLQACGAEVTTVASAESALQALKAAAEADKHIALALIDMKLPGINGTELARRIGEQPYSADVALVMVGIAHHPHTGSEAEQRAFVAKPIASARLLEAVSRGLAEARTPDRRPAAAAAPTHGTTGRPSVLLVEDNIVNIEVARHFLSDLVCDTTVAENGQQAVDILQQRTFDIVLMDCQMPVLDGLSATRLVRETERRAGLRRVPIIAITANAFEGDRKDCLAAGMDDYLSKPFTVQQLAAIIEKWKPKAPLRGADASPIATLPAEPGGNGAGKTTKSTRLRAIERALLIRIAPVFLESAPRQGQSLRQAIAGSAAETAGTIAHSLKSASANVGATRLAELASEMENLARGGHLPKRASVLMTEILSEIDAVVAELRVVTNSGKPARVA